MLAAVHACGALECPVCRPIGRRRERLVVVERDPDLYRLLQQHFPELTILKSDGRERLRVAARVWKNLPPASVWRYERRRATQRERRVA
jgi:phospholipid N-methyltransferase